METMSQFASEKDLWEARCLRFATALVDVMDGVQDHHIGDETGLPHSYSEEDVHEKTGDVFRHVWRAYPTVPSPIYATH